MNEQTMNTLLMTVGIELAVVFALIGCFLLWKMKRGKKADRNAAQVLVKSIKENEDGRRESLLQVFGESYDMEEEDLNEAVDEFLKRERTFFKTLISVYVERDAGEFSKLATALEEMVKPYSDLALSAELSVDNEELEALQEQNQVLGKELDESKKVMDELLSEYTATFDKEGEGKAPETVQEKAVEAASEVTEEDEQISNSDDEESGMEGTLELTVEASSVEEGIQEALDTGSDDLVVDEQNVSAEIEAELVTETQIDEQQGGNEDNSDEIVESVTNNEVALDEFDEDLETEVA